MTPDWAAKPTNVPYANFGNPQSLNLYAYVQNNPATVGDPDGHGDAGTFCDSACHIASAQYAAEHPVAAVLEPIVEFGTLPTLAIGGSAAGGSVLVRNMIGLGLATAPVTAPIVADTLEGLTPGQRLTLGRAGALGISAGNIEKLGEGAVVGKLSNGASISAGFERSGGSLGVSISNIATAVKGSINFKGLETNIVKLAEAEGASSVKITAKDVLNPKLAEALIKAGYVLERVVDAFGRVHYNYVKNLKTGAGV